MSGRYVVLSGGVGGAKLVYGLANILPPSDLTVIANTGDDFEHLGWTISPDIDTLIYTLAGEVNTETGWGRRNESWQFMAALEQLGGETWFRLGDRDLATHVMRTRALADGVTLSAVTATLCARFGVSANIVPMSDMPVRTRVQTPQGTLAFQHYFVRERAQPRVTGIEFDGAQAARPAPAVIRALRDPELAGIIVAPSNPYLSIDPILAVPGLCDALAAAVAPVVAVSPIVGGAALKGPTAKIMRELGVDASVESIAAHYRSWVDMLVVDDADRDHAAAYDAASMQIAVCPTVMNSAAGKVALAREVIQLCRTARTRP